MSEDDLERRSRELGLSLSRRSLIKGALGAGGALALGGLIDETEAARRGQSGPGAVLPNRPAWLVMMFDDGAGGIDYDISRNAIYYFERQITFLNVDLDPLYIEMTPKSSISGSTFIFPLARKGSAVAYFNEFGTVSFYGHTTTGRVGRTESVLVDS